MKRMEEFEEQATFKPKATFTPDEASKLMRAAGIPMSTEKLRAGIEQGNYPFGVFTQQRSREFDISKKQFFEWLAAFSHYATPRWIREVAKFNPEEEAEQWIDRQLNTRSDPDAR